MNIRLCFKRREDSRWLWVDYGDLEVAAEGAYKSTLVSMSRGKVHTVKLVLQDDGEEIEIKSKSLDENPAEYGD